MAKAIQWLPDVDAAKKKAQEEQKYVLLDFFNPPNYKDSEWAKRASVYRLL